MVHSRWSAATIGAAPAGTPLRDMTPDETTTAGIWLRHTLVESGWRRDEREHGVAAGQPAINFQLRLRRADGTQCRDDELLAGMSQQWRRNIRRAAKCGVVVELGTRADLHRFHALYVETAARSGFTGRPLRYFETMWDTLTADDPDRMRLYLAEHDGVLLAATTLVRVGEHAWYTYGASGAAGREYRGSNAVQWRMIRDANAQGCAVYDLRGINGGADRAGGGLLRFKAGTGGEAVEYVGEWDYPVSRPLYAAFQLYLTAARLRPRNS
jgi:lipid II:glycine glycyltransferase (peptidoglycan interpeptide bridge formation enzyme)